MSLVYVEHQIFNGLGLLATHWLQGQDIAGGIIRWVAKQQENHHPYPELPNNFGRTETPTLEWDDYSFTLLPEFQDNSDLCLRLKVKVERTDGRHLSQSDQRKIYAMVHGYTEDPERPCTRVPGLDSAVHYMEVNF